MVQIVLQTSNICNLINYMNMLYKYNYICLIIYAYYIIIYLIHSYEK